MGREPRTAGSGSGSVPGSGVPGAVGMLGVPSPCPGDGGSPSRAAFGRDCSQEPLAGAQPSPRVQPTRGYPVQSTRCPPGSSCSWLQMFVQGTDVTPAPTGTKELRFPPINLSFPGMDRIPGAPLWLFVGFAGFSLLFKQGLPLSPPFQRHSRSQELSLPRAPLNCDNTNP